MNLPIILASTSPRRKEILEKLGISFSIIESQYVEQTIVGTKVTLGQVKKLVVENAIGKAIAVANVHETGIVIGSDTLVFCDGQILGKPIDRKDAKRMLNFINGKLQYILTGMAVVKKTENRLDVVSDYASSKVWMVKATQEEHDWYLATGEPLGKAGAYAIQLKGAIFIKRFDGDFLAAIGLSVIKLLKLTKKLRIDLLGIKR